MKRTFIFILPLLLTISSCGDKNVFTDAAKKDTDLALREDAEKYINSGDYVAGIAKIDAMSESYGARSDMLTLKASAYAGLCGFNFLDFISALENNTSDALFLMSMRQFQTKAVVPVACAVAQATMERIGTVATRDANQNLFMALLGFAKMGTILRDKADADMDGAVDDVDNACKDTVLTGDDVRTVVTGLGLVLENIAALSAVLSGGSAVTDLESLQTKCNEASVSCTITDPTQIDDTAVAGFRTLIDTSAFGIGDCTDDPFITCCPP